MNIIKKKKIKIKHGIDLSSYQKEKETGTLSSNKILHFFIDEKEVNNI